MYFETKNCSELIRTSLFLLKQARGKMRGQVRELAEFLDLSSPHVSQFLSGVKCPNSDQIFLFSKFFSWTEIETEYAMTLMEYERAANHKTKSYFQKKLEKIRQQSKQLKSIVPNHQELSDADKSEFYSSWIYSGIRLYCSIGDGKTFEEICHAFHLTPEALLTVLEFLLKLSLLEKVGITYRMGTQVTYVAKGSPFLKNHHFNWRSYAVEKSRSISDDELMFTAPLSISKHAFKKYRQEIQALIKKFSTELPDSGDAEIVACLNIDFIQIL